jgi:5-methylcytosine-specific restriction endonuclease McrA
LISFVEYLLENSCEEKTDRSRRIKKVIKKKLYDIHHGCQICGEGTIGGSRTDKILEVHHYVPRNSGGTETLENSVLLCRNCHADVHNNKIQSPKPSIIK